MKMSRGQATREQLVTAAVALVRRAEGVTVRRVIDEAGANLNAVNYHFGSKEELVREAVRLIIGDWFRAQGVPRSGPGGFAATLLFAAGFLFGEPVAARLAIEAEVEKGGGGPTLTRETMEGLAKLLRAEHPELREPDARLRAMVAVAAAHFVFLRPNDCREFLGVDPDDGAARTRLVRRIVGLLTPA